MPHPLSIDLRERVVGFVEVGHSRHAAAAHFQVSVSFVVNLMKAYRTTGSLAPKPMGGRRHAKLDTHRAFLLARLAANWGVVCTLIYGFVEAYRPRGGCISRLDRHAKFLCRLGQ